jgi:hypothetical protein
MYQQPYDTSLLRGYPVATWVHALEALYIEGSLAPVVLEGDRSSSVVESQALVELLPGTDIPPPLVAPLLIHTPRDGVKVVMDVRALKRLRPNAPPVVIGGGDYRFLQREAMLTWLWANGEAVSFSHTGTLPIRVYARWIADGVARRLALSPLDQIRVSILAAYYYVCGFRNAEEQSTDGFKLGQASVISRAINVPVSQILELIEPLPTLTSLTDFVAALKMTTDLSLRMESMTPGIIYTLVGGSWFGARARSIVATALEYPPTFLTMLYTAYSDRSYHASYFAKTAIQADRQQQAKAFVLSLGHLTRGFFDA